MADGIDRRAFVGAGLAAAALPALARAQGIEPETLRIFDAVSGVGLARIKVIVKNVNARGRWAFRSDDDGYYPFGKIAASLAEPAPCRVRIKPTQLRNRHIGFEGFWMVNPGLGTNSGVGDIGLIPLTSASLPFNLGAAGEEEFRAKWLALLRELFFSVDRRPSPRPKQTAEGALASFGKGERLTVCVSDALAPTEYQLVRSNVGPALNILADGLFKKIRFCRVAAADAPASEKELVPGTITVTRRDDFPRPAVRIRYGNTNPFDIDANPNEILAALIILDTYTLDELFRARQGSGDEIALARHLLQRCTAGALGWGSTLMLPNSTVVDDNYGPPGAYTRKLITGYDRALHAAVSGGGSRCYAPGTRLSRYGLPRLVAEADFPLTPDPPPS